MTKILEQQIDQGRGISKADLVLKGGKIFDLVTGELIKGDVAISGDMIVGTLGEYSGIKEIDITGKILVPGFIDTHLHIESSLVTPYEFDRCVLPHGVTTAICDPHEIANVIGADGISYFLEAAQHTIMDVRVRLSSCVPATEFETSGAKLQVDDLTPFMDHPKALGLAEFMNFPAILNKNPEALAKIKAFQHQRIDGHAPQLRGYDLNGYLSAGIRTDHETTTVDEAMEKLRKGMQILVREGSVSKDLDALIPIITERNSPYLALCTDDRNPLDIAHEGHLDYMIRRAISKGVDPLAIYRAASISGARISRLDDRGLIAPGWRADIVILNDLNECDIDQVISAGRVVDEALFATRKIIAPVGRNSVNVPKVLVARLQAKACSNPVSVIGVVSGRIITEHLKLNLLMEKGIPMVSLDQDVVKIAVIERHGKNGNIGVGFVKGFGLQAGAIASTVGHDSHNITVIGVNDEDMGIAANRLREIEGGFVVARDGVVLAEIALPLAGLMSLEPYENVRDQLKILRKAALSLGTNLEEPFLQVVFLPLPVIPHLKMTDRGMFDVDLFQFVTEE